MTRHISYRWRLREMMASQGYWKTTDLVPLLADRGIELSTAQVYRLVARTPERLSLPVLAALCDILDCQPNDLIEPFVVERPTRRRTTAGAVALHDPERPRRARITRDT